MLSLVKLVDVRWSSMYAMLVHFNQLNESINLYVKNAMLGNDKDIKGKLEELTM